MNFATESHHGLRKAMTVAQLIEALQHCEPDSKVVFSVDYGDRGHTMQALGIEEVNELESPHEALVETAYSKSGLAIESLEDCDDRDAPVKSANIVILK